MIEMYIHTFIGTLPELSTSPSNDAQQHVRDDLLKDGVLDIGLADRRNLQSTYPKLANLIQILYIVCRALGCFKGGSCERFAEKKGKRQSIHENRKIML